MQEDNVKLCHKGDVIFEEGEYGAYLYRVLSGSVEVYANYKKPDEKLLTKLHEGDYFGEMAVIEITRRSATVVAAEEDTRLAEIDAADMGAYMKEHPQEICGIARHLSSRLRELTGDYTEVCDTLRELGRLDTSLDRPNESLMKRIRKFAKIYLMGQDPAGKVAEPIVHVAAQKCDKKLALHSVEYREDDVIFREADRSDCMYYIHEGRVGIFTAYGTEKQKLLTELAPAVFFGEMGLFEGKQRTATAVALENGTYLEVIYEKDLDSIYEKDPAMALMLLQHLSSRLRRLTEDYLKACKLLAETEKEIEARQSRLDPEFLARAEYLNQLLLMSEVMY